MYNTTSKNLASDGSTVILVIVGRIMIRVPNKLCSCAKETIGERFDEVSRCCSIGRYDFRRDRPTGGFIETLGVDFDR